MKRFLLEIQTLKTILSKTWENILANYDFKNIFDGQNSAFLEQCRGIAKPTYTSTNISSMERLKRAFLARKTRETVENLQRQCGTLSSLIAIDFHALSARIHKEIIEARKSSIILDYVTTVGFSSQQNDFIRRRQAAGKTLLTSIFVDDLYKRFQDNVNIGSVYVCYNFRQQADQKVEDFMSNLLRQLSHNQPSLPECLRILYDKYKGRTWLSFDELSRVLQTVANLFLRIFIVVDALDKCQLSDGSRSKFLTEIFTL
ncbi:hypothetical protein C7999DRAFT_44558 [Corynascus novoguineensis]|uniref:Nephrocystin 3-like N-terminal domain-containing protein n=1 Tax=Corynascus novoguineensis TaxID=1126955 RepID=A0AAN7CKA4_9PEZI|nr:hypothetical protein C7999DRAFT_44558 [Corynascus novoguineensis]